MLLWDAMLQARAQLRFSVSPQRGGQAPPPPAHCQLPTHAFLFLLRLLLFLSNCMLSNSEGLLKQNADMFSAFTPPATAFIFIPFEWTERMCMKSYLIRHTWHYAYEWRLCLLLFTWTVFTLYWSQHPALSPCVSCLWTVMSVDESSLQFSSRLPLFPSGSQKPSPLLSAWHSQLCQSRPESRFWTPPPSDYLFHFFLSLIELWRSSADWRKSCWE